MSQLADFGGKGLNLIRLREAGFEVPEFVVIPTKEYTAFVAETGLAAMIDAALAGLRESTVERVSNTIRAAFALTEIPDAHRARLARIIGPLLDREVAVRSSATAEDLAAASFAGQQDTFLNVPPAQIFERIVDCWASLWTAPALAYRLHHGIAHAGLALAVVVQEMVDADAAGVLFTANPMSGLRSETVIESVFGLGDKLVSGEVVPDRFVVDSGVVSSDVDGRASLTNHHAIALAQLGARIEEAFGSPQDIEWARVADRLWIVQTRPITSLFPLPDSGDDFAVWFSFGAFQGLLGPITPLGRDVLTSMAAGGAKLGGIELDRHENPYVGVAGERLWIRVDGLLRTPGVRKLLLKAMPIIDPASAVIVQGFADDPRLTPPSRTPRARSAGRIARTVGRLASRFPAALRNPRIARANVDSATRNLVVSVEQAMAAADQVFDPRSRLAARIAAIDAFSKDVFGQLIPVFAPIMGPGNAIVMQLRQLAERTGLPDSDELALTALQSLPGNVTTEMHFALADVAAKIRADAPSYGWVVTTPPARLAEQFLSSGLPRVAEESVSEFLASYGSRGVAEIDVGGPRWSEDTTSIWDSIASYLAIDDFSQWPQARYQRGVAQAEAAIEKLADASGVRGREVRKLAHTVRELFGARETPKFAIVRCLGLFRSALLESGVDMVRVGALGRPDDIFFLTLDELPRAFVGGWEDAVESRRDEFEREERRTRVPRVLVSDGRTFYDPPGAASDLRGDGVSPGVVEGAVRVVEDPASAGLEPGEILVCRGTSPAWTTLFGIAGGLVTEVGGLMTHGAVVAREYGLPAIVGVGQATTRLKDGQRVRLDGASGTITLLQT